MNDGSIEEGGAVVRVKTDLELPNPALRDWPALRIQHSPHPMVGDSYKVWPLLRFQSAIEDHLQGVTHIVRGKDLMDSTRKQTLLYKHFGWEYPEPSLGTSKGTRVWRFPHLWDESPILPMGNMRDGMIPVYLQFPL